MIGVKDSMLFSSIHDYLKVYLPYQQNCSKHTLRAYKYAIDTLLDFVKLQRNIPLSMVTFEMLDFKTISAFLDEVEVKNGCSVATRNGRLYAIRSFVHYATDAEPAAMIYRAEVDKVKTKKDDRSGVVAYLSETGMKTILEQPDVTTEKGLRNQFMMILLYDTAARIQELLSIRLRDLHLDETPTVTLHGKGSKIRSVPIMGKTVTYLNKYLEIYHHERDMRTDRPLFYVMRDGVPRAMCTDNARRIIRSYAEKAKTICPDIPNDVHPHMFRHSRAMHLYQHGMDLTLISQWLGHSQFETTLIYARADTEQKRRAIENATPKNGALSAHLNANRFTITDEDMLKRLCGLK